MNTVVEISVHTNQKNSHKCLVAVVGLDVAGPYKIVRATLPMPAPDNFTPREVSVIGPYRI